MHTNWAASSDYINLKSIQLVYVFFFSCSYFAFFTSFHSLPIPPLSQFSHQTNSRPPPSVRKTTQSTGIYFLTVFFLLLLFILYIYIYIYIYMCVCVCVCVCNGKWRIFPPYNSLITSWNRVHSSIMIFPSSSLSEWLWSHCQHFSLL